MEKDEHFHSLYQSWAGYLERMFTLKAQKLVFNSQIGTFIDDSHGADSVTVVKPLILGEERGWWHAFSIFYIVQFVQNYYISGYI